MDLRPRNLLQRLADAARPNDADDGRAPDTPDTVPAPPVRGGARLPDWRLPKPLLGTGGEEPAGDQRILTKPPDDEPADDGRDEDGEDADDGEEPKTRRWLPGRSGTRAYSRPTYSAARPAPRQSVIEWWQGMSAPTRWGLYNGTALAGGFALSLPQFVTHETAYLVTTRGSWTNPYVIFWYFIALTVWAIDYRTRNWPPLFAVAARVPLISLVVGVLLYGSTDFPS